MGVVRTCGESLSSQEVKNLALTGGQSRFVQTVLRFNQKTSQYSAEAHRGTLCERNEIGKRYILEENRVLICAESSARTSGTYKVLNNNEITFQGIDIVGSSFGTTLAYSGIGRNWKNFLFEVTNEILVLELMDYYAANCASGRQIHYFIRPPIN